MAETPRKIELEIEGQIGAAFEGKLRAIVREELDKAFAARDAAELGDPDVQDKSAAGRWLALRRWRRPQR